MSVLNKKQYFFNKTVKTKRKLNTPKENNYKGYAKVIAEINTRKWCINVNIQSQANECYKNEKEE